MDTFIVLLQVGLSAVLAVAGVAKLRDLDGSRQAVSDFGVPARLAAPFGVALPVVELTLAALLLPESTAAAAALAAAALFLVFVAAIGWNLRQGRQPDCHCFGQLHSEPAGWPTLVRNVALATIALVVVGEGGRSIAGWFGDLSAEGQASLLVGLPVLAALLAQLRQGQALARQNGDLLDRLDTVAGLLSRAPGTAVAGPAGGEPGKPAPAFDLPRLDGSRLTLDGLLGGGRPVLLLFMSPTCGPCNALMPDVGEWTRRFASDLTIGVISTGSVDDNRAKTADHGVMAVGLQEWPEVSKPYGVNATPTAVLIGADGLITEPNANGRNQIRKLVTRTVDQRPAAPPVQGDGPLDYAADGSLAESPFPDAARSLAVGMAAPRLPLPNLAGGYSSLDDFRGDAFLLIFWNTDCGFCQRMLPDLREWEAEAGAGSLKLIVASAGAPEAVRELGLRSTMLLDDGLAGISKAFGAPGTPSAVLIGPDGRIDSDILIGADAILDFLDEQALAEDAQAREPATLAP